MTLVSENFLIFCLVFFAGYFSFWKIQGLRLLWLSLSGVLLYAYYNASLLPILFCIVVVDYALAIAISEIRNPKLRKFLLFINIALNLSVLFYFKYKGFLLTEVLGRKASDLAVIGNTLGISFFTFESISYVVDVYNRRTTPIRNPLVYLSFLSYFPHVFAGPIVRAREFSSGWRHLKTPSARRAGYALWLIVRGCFRKVVIADTLSTVVEGLYHSPTPRSGTHVLVGVLLFSIQIYHDFAGYTDLARGLSYLIGIRIRINFNNPYLSQSLKEFWTRWHISLSQWFRDYVYIPLGGRNLNLPKRFFALLLTMSLCGFWHGAEWKFLAWGAYHGVLSFIEHCLRSPGIKNSRWSLSRQSLTFFFVLVGWELFRANNLAQAGQHLSVLLAEGQTNLICGALGLVFLGGLDLLVSKEILKRAIFFKVLTMGILFGLWRTQLLAPEIGLAVICGNLSLLEPVIKKLRIGTVMLSPTIATLEVAAMITLILSLVVQNKHGFIYFQF